MEKILNEMVQRYVDAGGTDIIGNYVKAITYIQSKKDSVSRESFCSLIQKVCTHYITQVTSSKLNLKEYIPSNFNTVKPYIEAFNKCVKEGTDINVDWYTVYSTMQPFDIANIQYKYQNAIYKLGKLKNVTSKYTTNPTATDEFKIPTSVAEELEQYQSPLRDCTNLEELITQYDSTVAAVANYIKAAITEDSTIPKEKKHSTMQAAFAKYKTLFNARLEEFERSMTFKSKWYTSNYNCNEIVDTMLTHTTNVEDTVLEIADVLAYRYKTHRMVPAIYAEQLQRLITINDNITNGMNPTDAVELAVTGKIEKYEHSTIEVEITQEEVESFINGTDYTK